MGFLVRILKTPTSYLGLSGLMLTGLFFVFQNCSTSGHEVPQVADLSSLMDPYYPEIWHKNRLLTNKKDIIFYLHPQFIQSQSVSIFWLSELDGDLSVCDLKPYENYKNAIIVHCEQDGELTLSVNLLDSESESTFSLQSVFELVEKTPFNTVPGEDEYFKLEEVVVDVNGIAGGLSFDYGKDDLIDPSLLDGRQLYVQHCQSCHDSIETSSLRGASFFQVNTSFTEVTLMRPLRFSVSPSQRQAITNALSQ